MGNALFAAAATPRSACGPRSPTVSVIVPTYREAENLAVLIPRVHAALREAGLSGEILIVDDNSPDNTPAVVAALALEYPVRLHMRRTERGLSSAVLAGMRLARNDILVVMDADLSHPPEKVPELVAALRDPEVDFVIGSRYVPGAATAEEWGLFRWLNSRVATLLARPLTSARDPMAGFFALPRSTLARAAPLDPIGYKIGLELLVKCDCRKVVEVPIFFKDRLYGQSKLTLRQQIDYLRHLKRLLEFKAGRLASPLLFCLVGLSGMMIDMLAFGLLRLVAPLAAARALAIWLAMTWNFQLNRRVTFTRADADPVWRQYLLFCGSCFVGALANWSTSMALCSASSFFAAYPVFAAACGVAAGFVFNYVLSLKVVFRQATKDPPSWPEPAPGSHSVTS